MCRTGLSKMLSRKKKLQIAAAFAVLLLFAMAVGCTGFFVNPTLTGLTVGPSATINQGQTVQMTAVGTYNDGSTKTLGSGVYWNSSATNIASISTSGLVTGISPGTATINASSGAVTGSATVTISLDVTAIQVTPITTSIIEGGQQQYKAEGTYNGKQQDISTIVTWNIDNTINDTASIDSTGLLTTASTGQTSNEIIHVTATAANGVTSNTATLTVTP